MGAEFKRVTHYYTLVLEVVMFKRTLVISCVSCVALTLSGCIGLILNTPGECKNETPFTGVHDIFWKKPHPKQELIFGLVIPEVPAPKASNKNEFLTDWGKPDEIISTSENMETWIYNRKLWCGFMPVLILPVPFILPVCDGFDRIEFKDNIAIRLHTRSIVWGGAVGFFVGGGSGGKDPVCRYPLHTSNVGNSDATVPPEQARP